MLSKKPPLNLHGSSQKFFVDTQKFFSLLEESGESGIESFIVYFEEHMKSFYSNKHRFEYALLGVGFDRLAPQQLEKFFLHYSTIRQKEEIDFFLKSNDDLVCTRKQYLMKEGLSSLESFYVYDYTAGSSRSINAYLRDSSVFFSCSQMVELLLWKLQSIFIIAGMKKLKNMSKDHISTLQKNYGYPVSGNLFRNVGFETKEELDIFLSQFNQGEKWSDQGILSTTINKDLGFMTDSRYFCMITIQDPSNGIDTAPFSYYGATEGEIVFRSGEQFTVILAPQEISCGVRNITITNLG